MAKYRKKPEVIEAEQYSRVRHVRTGYVPAGVVKRYGVNEEGAEYEREPVCKTLEGDLTVSDGDWIITGVKGEHYPCKEDVFRMTYEPVDPAPRKEPCSICGRLVEHWVDPEGGPGRMCVACLREKYPELCPSLAAPAVTGPAAGKE
jgi:hypothetical protein